MNLFLGLSLKNVHWILKNVYYRKKNIRCIHDVKYTSIPAIVIIF